jgi:hypothetical protein
MHFLKRRSYKVHNNHIGTIPRLIQLWSLIFIGLVLTCPISASAAPETSNAPTQRIDWQDVKRRAAEFVSSDSTDTSLPFERPNKASLSSSGRKVFIYYFPFFLISMDNWPIPQDHWTVHYLQRTGEGGKYAADGGFVRERPLPAGPWPTPAWREIDEAIDVLRAKAIGADGFGVGIQGPGTEKSLEIPLGVANAAAHVTNDFHVFAEPDGGVLKDVSADAMASAIKAFNSTAATFRLPDGHALLAPFAPQVEPVAYWADVLARLRSLGSASDFIPILLNPVQYGAVFAPISAGLSFWGFRDPATMDSPSGIALMKSMHSLSPLWMQPVTPQDFRPKDAIFWEARNTEAFRDAWMEAIRGGAQYVHLITWNDYSEATEIGPSSGTQFLFYDLSAYYVAWFKTGKAPRILRDAIYYSHRDQIFQPDQPPLATDRPYRRFGDTPVSNDIEMLGMLTRPATLEIEISGHVYRQKAEAGLTAFRVPAAVGRPRFRILRDGRIALEKLSDWTIEAKPTAISGLYFGGSSTRPFIPIPIAAP